MKIDKIIGMIIMGCMFASCANGYLIEGNSSLSRLDGKMLFLKVQNGAEMVKVDSSEVVHGLFRMEGELDSVSFAALYMDDQGIMPLVVENGNTQILIDNARIVVRGTPLNEKLYDFVAKKNGLDDRKYELERLESRLILDGKTLEEAREEVASERMALEKEQNLLVKSFIQDNYENVLGPGVFIMLCNGFPYPLINPLIEEIMDEAPEAFKNHLLVKEYMKLATENMEMLKAQQ